MSTSATSVDPGLGPVIAATRSFLADRVVDLVDPLVEAVAQYYVQSDRLAAALVAAIEPGPGVDLYGDPRRRLLLAAVSDLLVFRCIGIVDTWAAVADMPEAADDAERMHTFLVRDVDDLDMTVGELGLAQVWGRATAPDLTGLVREVARRVADDSTSTVIEAVVGSLGGLLPDGTSRRVIRALHRLGPIAHLDRLLDWAQRVLNLALDKLRRLFGPQFDAIESQVRTLIDAIVKVRERVANRLFSVPELASRCDEKIGELPRTKVPERQIALDRVRANFGLWDKGFDVAGTCLKWGWRTGAVAPPVAAALAAVRGVLACGAFLVGQYHLDSPELGIVPWSSRGVYRALAEDAEVTVTPSKPKPRKYRI